MPSPVFASIAALLLLLWVLRKLWLYGTVIEPFRIEVTRHEVLLDRLPEGLDGLVLCQVSDLHIAWEARNRVQIAEAIRSVKADLFLLTGDLVYGSAGPDAFLQWFDELGDAIRPAIAIFGNAEYKPAVDAQPLADGLARRGVILLRNQSVLLRLKGAELRIVGVDDPHTGLDDFEAAYRDVPPDEFALLLAHSPDGVAHLDGRHADLILSGHTHGGQIRFGRLGPLRTNTHTVKGLVAGWYAGDELARKSGAPAGGSRLYISRGLGMNWIPLRIGSPPELAMFSLRSKVVG